MSRRPTEPSYIETLRQTKSLLIVSNLQRRLDLKARELVEAFEETLSFEPLDELMIEERAWQHVLGLNIRPQLVFCHPRILILHPTTSLYYRGMTGAVDESSEGVLWRDRETGIRHKESQFNARKSTHDGAHL